MASGESEIEILPEDDTWVFESLVNFLHGPLWKLPVSGFIEEKSVVFDPESYNEELTPERATEFKKIHEEYKALVDFMLGSFMEDLEVSPEQVENACRSRHDPTKAQQPDSQLTKVALQQLSAAEEFDTFRRLMTRKNIDLQLQSLELLVSKYGVLSSTLRTSTGDDEEQAMDDDFLQLVLRYTREAANLDKEEELAHASLHHYSPEPKRQMHEAESAEFGKGVLISIPRCANTVAPTVEAVVETKNFLETETELESIAEAQAEAPQQRRMLASVRRALDSEESSLHHEEKLNDSAKITTQETAGTVSVPVTEEDVQRRREYMREQRDKLVALKKKEREKMMALDSASQGRPRSSKAAQTALKTIAKIKPDEKSLAARKALANRLKEELQPK